MEEEDGWVCISCEDQEIRQNAVEEMRNQNDKLENSEMRLRFYREGIKELAQKYIQFLNPDQSAAVLKCQEIVGQWDNLKLPVQPSLTDVAKAVRYAKFKDGGPTRQRKHGARQPKNKRCNAQIRERAFFDSVSKSVRNWQEEAQAKCVLVDEIDSYIDKLHSIVSMLDSRFHHDLERFFADEGTGRLREDPRSTSTKSRISKKSLRVLHVKNDELTKPKTIVPIELVSEGEGKDPIEEMFKTFGSKQLSLKETEIEICTTKKERGVQTEDVDLNNSSFTELDEDVDLFEISDYECNYNEEE